MQSHPRKSPEIKTRRCDLSCKTVILVVKTLTCSDLRDHQHPSQDVNHIRDLSESRSDLKLDLKMRRVPKGRKKKHLFRDLSVLQSRMMKLIRLFKTHYLLLFSAPNLAKTQSMPKKDYWRQNCNGTEGKTRKYIAKVPLTLKKVSFWW